MRIRALFWMMLMVSGVVLPPARADTGSTEKIAEAARLTAAARNGDGEAAEQAVDLMQGVLKAEPENALASAYLGVAYSLKGRDADTIVNKIRFTNRAIRYLDHALENGADDFLVRVLRANVNISLPKMFKREEPLVDDMRTLQRLYADAPSARRGAMLLPLYEKMSERDPEGGWDAVVNELRNTGSHQ